MPANDSRDLFSLELTQGTCLVFQRQGDRFHHYLEQPQGSARVKIAESLEGSDSQTWPPSPPLQEIAIHQDEHGTVLLGVGRAGRSHWSIAVSAVASTPGQPNDTFRFEVACRTRDLPEQLASSYQVFDSSLGTWQLTSSPEPFQTQFSAGQWSCQLTPASHPPASHRVGTFVWTYQWTAKS